MAAFTSYLKRDERLCAVVIGCALIGVSFYNFPRTISAPSLVCGAIGGQAVVFDHKSDFQVMADSVGTGFVELAAAGAHISHKTDHALATSRQPAGYRQH